MLLYTSVPCCTCVASIPAHYSPYYYPLTIVVLILWLSFAVQVYLGILQTNGQDGDALETIVTRGESPKSSTSLLDVPEAESSRGAPRRWPLGRGPDLGRAQARRRCGIAPQRCGHRPFKFLRRKPQCTAGCRFITCAATRRRPALSSAWVQLYHALCREGPGARGLRVGGPERTLWKLQGDASFFVGDLPTTEEAYFTNYCLSIGTSVTHLGGCTESPQDKGQGQGAQRQPAQPEAIGLLLAGRQPSPRTSRAAGPMVGRDRPGGARPRLCPPLHRQPIAHQVRSQGHGRGGQAALRGAPAGRLGPRSGRDCRGGVILPWRIQILHLHHEAWLFLERLQAGLIAGPGPGPGLAPPPRGYSNARRCCLLYRVCALPPPRASRSTTPKTVPTSDAPLRTTAAVLQKLVGEGHGRRMVDDSHSEVEPERGVQPMAFG
ncbi:hypothetical protein BBAD15_g4973 [Beauveria bassiana D1-5]|uniref:Uncharacterized protein n=1 Tax=Beauveria bassiana D1-5 TaxID=1245745 RepID=A0A0A2VU85_BEABA|nr:hypothetical protein BBAD15_g4973 [Beauveria bassiana D1-5]